MCYINRTTYLEVDKVHKSVYHTRKGTRVYPVIIFGNYSVYIEDVINLNTISQLSNENKIFSDYGNVREIMI